MMTDHFIKNIEINNFKCFDSFKAKGFARVNLIGGKNNVGKTAFMEACYINSSAIELQNFTASLHSVKFMRENLNLLLSSIKYDVKDDVKAFIEQSSGIFVETNINIISFKIDGKEEGIKKYYFKFSNKTVTISSKDFSFERKSTINNIFIDSFGLSNIEIINYYSSIQKRDKETYLNELLNKFDSNITSFKIIEETPQCKVGNKYLPLTELGDGVRHLVSIVVCIFASENGYLFIDEVENGIHYTMLDDIWKLIISLSKELNVQVFATTHSRECIESFNRIQLQSIDNSSSYFELAKEKETNEIFISALSSRQLEYELTNKGKFRGE